MGVATASVVRPSPGASPSRRRSRLAPGTPASAAHSGPLPRARRVGLRREQGTPTSTKGRAALPAHLVNADGGCRRGDSEMEKYSREGGERRGRVRVKQGWRRRVGYEGEGARVHGFLSCLYMGVEINGSTC
jgi:hypothetical protein